MIIVNKDLTLIMLRINHKILFFEALKAFKKLNILFLEKSLINQEALTLGSKYKEVPFAQSGI